MGTLGNISSAEAIRALERFGFRVRNQSGSHIVLTRPGHPKIVTVPRRRELKIGTLRSCIRDAGLTVDEFLALL